MAITSGAHPRQLWPGVKKIWGASYNEKPMVCNTIFKQETSDKSYERTVEEAGFGLAPKKAEGQGYSYDTDIQGTVTTFYNVTYGLGAKVSREAIEDNKYFDVASRKSRKLARSMRLTRENVHANILNRAFNSSYTGGDGKELLATDHPSQAGDMANEPSAAVDLSEAAIEDALTDIRGFKDARGLRIEAMGKYLVVPSALEFDATRIMASTLQSGTGNNDLNAMKQLGSLPGGVVVWDYLTDTDAWFIVTDADDGLTTMNRRAVALEQDNDFDTDNALMKASERFAVGWSDWRGVYGSPGA